MKELLNPYESVNWAWKQQKANLHTHTRESDGSVYGGRMIDLYKQANYDILMITDHDVAGSRFPGRDKMEFGGVPYTNTWRWSVFEGNESHQSPVGSLSRNDVTGVVANGMLTAECCELSARHHTNIYDNSYAGEIGYKEGEALKKVKAHNGLAVLNHPGEYNNLYTFYTRLYRTNVNTLIGMEVINRNRYFDGGVTANRRGDSSDRVLWDKLTKEFSVINSFMSRPKIWGYSNDDTHIEGEVGGNYQFMLMPKLTIKNFRHALSHGHSYFSYEPLRSGEAKAPRISSIVVDRDIKTVTITGVNQDDFTWIVDGEESPNKSNVFVYNDDMCFFRAELRNSFGETYTQPFILTPKLMFNWI